MLVRARTAGESRAYEAGYAQGALDMQERGHAFVLGVVQLFDPALRAGYSGAILGGVPVAGPTEEDRMTTREQDGIIEGIADAHGAARVLPLVEKHGGAVLACGWEDDEAGDGGRRLGSWVFVTVDGVGSRAATRREVEGALHRERLRAGATLRCGEQLAARVPEAGERVMVKLCVDADRGGVFVTLVGLDCELEGEAPGLYYLRAVDA